tara:strand:+ start:58497 stop:59720 length:1224 start_codon:yes stop_codon:yes gene_type:complete
MNHSYVLVINCGSSSLKFALYDTHAQPDFKPLKLLAEGIAEHVNSNTANITIRKHPEKTSSPLDLNEHDPEFHAKSLEYILDHLDKDFHLHGNLLGVGHRVVHGGNIFSQSVVITDQVLQQIKECASLAPLHNPANIIGIESLKSHFPILPQVAVFDTAFHQTMPDFAYTYALPKAWSNNYQIRRYGFHGTSHRYVSQQAASFFEKDLSELSVITAHLGNGASVTAISGGKSVDTSMGMTPLEGLVMGTRSGDVDPGIFDYLTTKGHSIQEINQVLNKKSGLLGISDISHDMRTLCDAAENGHPDASLALEVFCFKAAKYIASMSASLKHLDALIFTGGIGENATHIRHMIVDHLSILGLKIDTQKNNQTKIDDAMIMSIHSPDSGPILVIPTDEEAMIVSDTLQLI